MTPLIVNNLLCLMTQDKVQAAGCGTAVMLQNYKLAVLYNKEHPHKVNPTTAAQLALTFKTDPVYITSKPPSRDPVPQPDNTVQYPFVFCDHATNCLCPAPLMQNNFPSITFALVCAPPELAVTYAEDIWVLPLHELTDDPKVTSRHTTRPKYILSPHHIFGDETSICGTVLPRLLRRQSICSLLRDDLVYYEPPLHAHNWYSDPTLAAAMHQQMLRPELKQYTKHMIDKQGLSIAENVTSCTGKLQVY
jgi:hypothetical protein